MVLEVSFASLRFFADYQWKLLILEHPDFAVARRRVCFQSNCFWR